MQVDGLKDATDEPGWEVDPDDDWGVAVVETVGRQLRLRREAVGMRVADFAVAISLAESAAARRRASSMEWPRDHSWYSAASRMNTLSKRCE
ncbi:hypothetical protein SsS58_01362 [Streptomyces scabiei]|uniref:Uncharacterized protein n=1 Tax=Streptomyces scabiei TaxID=1930 RepID=A0A100JK43_STRSC|nr:hypothetical protein SsS58_01362 [Streptomyces scabiei]